MHPFIIVMLTLLGSSFVLAFLAFRLNRDYQKDVERLTKHGRKYLEEKQKNQITRDSITPTVLLTKNSAISNYSKFIARSVLSPTSRRLPRHNRGDQTILL